MIDLKFVTTQDALHNYHEAWNALFESNKREASVSFEWTRALFLSHLNEKNLFQLIAISKNDQYVGFVPLVFHTARKFGQTVTTLMPISELYGTHSDLLLEENGQDLTARLLKEIFQLEKRWDVFVLWRILEQSTLFSQLKTCLESSDIRYKLKREEPSFFITLDCTYDGYLKRRSSKFRNYLRRMEKKLSSQGNVEVKFFGNCDQNNSCFEEILSIERRSWKQNHKTAITSVGKQEAFYRSLYELSSKNGRWHLLIMYLNGRAIAYDMGIIDKGTYYYLKTSFDEEFRALSPATVLRAQLIRDLISRGVKYFDFPGEPYEWESQWSNELRWHYSVIIYNSNIKATLLSIFNRLRDRLRGEAVQNAIKYHDPLDTKPETN